MCIPNIYPICEKKYLVLFVLRRPHLVAPACPAPGSNEYVAYI